MNKNVFLGAVDWRHPAWVGAFYPADMPEEWRLAFYSSQFSCVWLAPESWNGVAAAEMVAWHDDVHSKFRFLLAADETSKLPESLADKATLVIPGDSRLLWFDRGSDLKVLAAAIQAREEAPELFLIGRDGDLGQLERVRTLLELMGY